MTTALGASFDRRHQRLDDQVAPTERWSKCVV
jgi:hypothetical protein